jgi:acyl carrier protein
MFSNPFKRTKPPPASDLLQLLYGLIIKVLDKGDINIVLTPETELDDIGFDSIKYIHLFLSLEDIVKADLEEIISNIDLSNIRTIKDVHDLLQRINKSH